MKNEVILGDSIGRYSDEEKIRAAYALNMCMVSVSQIIDYDDLNILEQEYEGILNNLNLEMMPKDEALLSIIKQLLDTITFFRMREGDKKLIDREYQQTMKNAIWSAVPNLGLIVAGGNPVTMTISLASQVGIGYMNYRRVKSENQLEHDKQQWQLQRSAMEQFNGLRRELFDTAWRLADTYKFPDEYRLTERQIRQYDEILMDNDEIRRYERLTTIKDKFIAYPPFWYHYGSTANYISRDRTVNLSDEARMQYRLEALDHFETYWKANRFALLREDQLASSCALEHVDLLDINRDRAKIAELLDKAVKFSGYANDILQLCAVAYLKLGEKEKASELLRILVNEEYNITVNAQILSSLYVNRVLTDNDMTARAKYETLATRVNPDYLFGMPAIGMKADEEELNSNFCERQEDLLQKKFRAVINYCVNEFDIRLGKILPSPKSNEKYQDEYFTEAGMRQRIEDIKELFGSHYPAKKRKDYLERVSQSGFINAYFEELNRFFDVISGLNCIRDRQILQDIIKKKIVELSPNLNALVKKMEDKKMLWEDMCQLLALTSVNIYEKFVVELKNQIDQSIFGMTDMSMYATADSALRNFCEENRIPEPDVLMEDGKDVSPDQGVNTYFSMELLGDEGMKYQEERGRYLEIETILKKHTDEINKISEKASIYFHDSAEFNSYFENSKLKKHKDILQKTIAIYDDKSMHNVDIMFTTEGIVPIVRGSVKTSIPYIQLAGDDVKKKAIALLGGMTDKGKDVALAYPGAVLVPGIAAIVMCVTVLDSKFVKSVTDALQGMIDEISYVILDEATTLK